MILLQTFNVRTVFADYLLDSAILIFSFSVNSTSNNNTMEVMPLVTLYIMLMPTHVIWTQCSLAIAPHG
jgi:hypothetical protein